MKPTCLGVPSSGVTSGQRWGWFGILVQTQQWPMVELTKCCRVYLRCPFCKGKEGIQQPDATPPLNLRKRPHKLSKRTPHSSAMDPVFSTNLFVVLPTEDCSFFQSSFSDFFSGHPWSLPTPHGAMRSTKTRWNPADRSVQKNLQNDKRFHTKKEPFKGSQIT